MFFFFFHIIVCLFFDGRSWADMADDDDMFTPPILTGLAPATPTTTGSDSAATSVIEANKSAVNNQKSKSAPNTNTSNDNTEPNTDNKIVDKPVDKSKPNTEKPSVDVAEEVFFFFGNFFFFNNYRNTTIKQHFFSLNGIKQMFVCYSYELSLFTKTVLLTVFMIVFIEMLFNRSISIIVI